MKHLTSFYNMITTLKSELRLRPTYDELVGMIEAQGDPNRPSIEQAIDRKATILRNNQFGSQFDNLDFLGLKKQEEDKVKNELRQAQLRQTAIATGSSMGVLTSSVGSSGFTTPLLDTPSGEEYLGHLDIERIRAELSELERGQQQAQQATTSTARSDLDEAHRQSLPVGVMDEEEEDMPPLVNIEEGEEEEDFDDDPELIPADDDETTKAPAQARKHKETIDYSAKITKWQDKSVQENDIRFQLFLRGIELTPEQEEEISKLKVKGKGRNQTRKDYLIIILID